MRIKAYDKIRKNRMGGKYNNLNQGATPVEFVLGKSKDTIRDHTLDGYRRAGSKLVKDNKSSVAGYLKPTSSVKGKKQIGSNLYTKLLQNGGVFNIKGDNTYEYRKTDSGYATRKQGSDKWINISRNTLSEENYNEAISKLDEESAKYVSTAPKNLTVELTIPGDDQYKYIINADTKGSKNYFAFDKNTSKLIDLTANLNAITTINSYLSSSLLNEPTDKEWREAQEFTKNEEDFKKAEVFNFYLNELNKYNVPDALVENAIDAYETAGDVNSIKSVYDHYKDRKVNKYLKKIGFVYSKGGTLKKKSLKV